MTTQSATTQSARRSLISRLPSTLLAAAALTAVSLLLFGYASVGLQRLGTVDLQALWANDEKLLSSAVGWMLLMSSLESGLEALLPGGLLRPGIVNLTLVSWMSWDYAALFIFRQVSHNEVGRGGLAWLGGLFVLPAAAIMVPLLYAYWAPAGQAAGQGGFIGLLTDLVAVALVIFLASILLLPRRIPMGLIAAQALTWGLIYAAVLWGLKTLGVQALGPLAMLVVVVFLLCLCLMLALQRATDGLADLADLGEAQALEYGLMILGGLATSKDKISAADLSARTRVPQAETDELLRRFKDASLARATQGGWAGVWPADRTVIAAVAGALGLPDRIMATANTPMVAEAHSLGWQGVSLADLISMPPEAVRKTPQEPHTLETIDAATAAAMPLAARPAAPVADHQAAALSATPRAPEPQAMPQAEPGPMTAPEPDVKPDVKPAPASVPAATAMPEDGHRMVRSPETSALRQATPQNRALSLALGRPAAVGQPSGIVGAGDYAVMTSGHSPWQAGQKQQHHSTATPVAGSQDYAAMVAGVSNWRGQGEGPEIEPNDDAVTLDAIRREIQALLEED